MSEFQNDVAVVTGAGSGIGQDIAVEFAAEGARVVVGDVDRDGGEDTVETIENAGGEAVFVDADVTDVDAMRRMVEVAVEEYGQLDYGINNAGIGGPSATTGEYGEASWQRVIDVNLSGVWRSMKAELEHLTEQDEGGAIVNVASILGLVGFASAPAYVAAKHGVVGLTKTAALEYAEQDVRVNAVCPGFVETPLLEEGGITTDPETRSQIESLHAMNRLGRPEEVTAAVLWACSDGASFLTGEEITVDGGYTAR